MNVSMVQDNILICLLLLGAIRDWGFHIAKHDRKIQRTMLEKIWKKDRQHFFPLVEAFGR